MEFKEGHKVLMWDNESDKVECYFIEEVEFDDCTKCFIGSLVWPPEFGCLVSYENICRIDE